MKEKERKLLILDDNPEILDMITESLSITGFSHLTRAASKKEALELLEREAFDLAILDIMLPDGSGFEVLREIRKNSNMPVLFLSAVSDIEKQYQGFELGADDYIVKPFRPKELELRLLSILKRSYPPQDDVVQLDSCQIDFERAAILKEDQEIPLTAKEYSLLKVLYDHKNKIVTFDQLLSKVWGDNYQGYENTLMAHIRKVRQKIEANPSKPVHLITIKRLGYQLRVD
ncbi:MAG: response regulator transcription factor [Streptococcus orisratti]|uniref:response regulator transcription factor n=1 Tax=Streptococcus orisratti TaxID=114652 RepID=UPI0023536922|nr:response regulator transcription factor [Streptococcus orisratti]MCI7677936.1 response regulator transcription factor [Streptococcus orisratti]MDY5636603.1 response regulator transcription factor [Streptococcus orisratti]